MPSSRAKSRRTAAPAAKASAKAPTTAADRRATAAFWTFAVSSIVFALTWWLGFSLRLPLYGVDLASVATGSIRREVPPLDSGAFYEFLFVLIVCCASYLAALWALKRGFPQS